MEFHIYYMTILRKFQVSIASIVYVLISILLANHLRGKILAKKVKEEDSSHVMSGWCMAPHGGYLDWWHRVKRARHLLHTVMKHYQLKNFFYCLSDLFRIVNLA